MKASTVIGGCLLFALVAAICIGVFVVVLDRVVQEEATVITTLEEIGVVPEDFLYGRVTSTDGSTYEGRLRFGDGEEAFWSDAFNAHKLENPWIEFVDPALLEVTESNEIFGIRLKDRKVQMNLDRPFTSRFGDIVRIDAEDGLSVTLKSGTTFVLDRMNADDFADGIRVWDPDVGLVKLSERRIKSIEFFANPEPFGESERLHGTVYSSEGEFTGSITWNRRKPLLTDEIVGNSDQGRERLAFGTISTITRLSSNRSSVTLLDGSEMELSDSRDVGRGHRGLFVDDERFGRVLIQWNAVERVEFTRGGHGPAYEDFAPGYAMRGTVTVAGGRSLAGRVVFDLDESESTENLDAPWGDVNYTIPFGLIESIEKSGNNGGPIRVGLRNGEALQLERGGDLGQQNPGVLVFIGNSQRAEFVRWDNVESISFDSPEGES